MSLRPTLVRLAQHARQPMMHFPDRKAPREFSRRAFHRLVVRNQTTQEALFGR